MKQDPVSRYNLQEKNPPSLLEAMNVNHMSKFTILSPVIVITTGYLKKNNARSTIHKQKLSDIPHFFFPAKQLIV
jgi:hypothetical protein